MMDVKFHKVDGILLAVYEDGRAYRLQGVTWQPLPDLPI